MINFEKQFERMVKDFDNVQQEYLEFKCNRTKAQRKKLIEQIKVFSLQKIRFTTSVRNMNLKEM